MTLYCQILDELPAAQMARLGPGARSSHFLDLDPHTGVEVERYIYRWRDFEVNFYLTRQPEIAAHLQGFIEYASRRARASGRALDRAFVRRIQATRLVIGYDAGPNYLEQSRFERLEDMIVSMRHSTQSLLLWEGAIYDEHGRLLIG